jgi:protein SCO1
MGGFVVESRAVLALVALVSLANCTTAEREDSRTLPYYDSPDYTPRWEVSTADTSFHRIRSFTLTSHLGEPFTEKDLRGKIVVADFFFTTCPSVCPRMAKSMQNLQAVFRDDENVLLISHTVTPDVDTVDVLQAYATEYDVSPRQWKLLTGSRDEIYDLGRRYYFVEEDLGTRKAPGDFLHTENFVLLDKYQHLRGIYNSLDPGSMRALVADIRVLEREK